MFFKMSVLKKLMKKAYKGGCLVIGNHQVVEDDGVVMEGYVVSSGWWSLYIDIEHTPKELKAAIMELCGEIPYESRWFKASESMGNQEMIPFTEAVHPLSLFQTSKVPVKVTNLTMNSNIRLLQNSRSNAVSGVQEVVFELLDNKYIEEEAGEYEPIGPLTKDNQVFSWGNNVCYFSVWPVRLLDETKEDEKTRFFDTLSRISIPEDV